MDIINITELIIYVSNVVDTYRFQYYSKCKSKTRNIRRDTLEMY